MVGIESRYLDRWNASLERCSKGRQSSRDMTRRTRHLLFCEKLQRAEVCPCYNGLITWCARLRRVGGWSGAGGRLYKWRPTIFGVGGESGISMLPVLFGISGEADMIMSPAVASVRHWSRLTLTQNLGGQHDTYSYSFIWGALDGQAATSNRQQGTMCQQSTTGPCC